LHGHGTRPRATHALTPTSSGFCWHPWAPIAYTLDKYDGLALPVLLATGLYLVLRDEAGSVFGTFLIACGLLWVFADAFLIPGMVREYNRRLERALTRHQPD